MRLLRSAAVGSKYLWWSVIPRWSRAAQTTHNPCRNIATGLDSARLGNIGGKIGSYDLLTLEEFIGTWHEVKTKNYAEFLRAIGSPQGTVDLLTSHKSWLKYSVEDEEVTCIYGVEGIDTTGEYTFMLGKPVNFFFFYNGLEVKTTVYQHKDTLNEKHVSLTDPGFVIDIGRTITGKNAMTTRFFFKNLEAKMTLKRK